MAMLMDISQALKPGYNPTAAPSLPDIAGLEIHLLAGAGVYQDAGATTPAAAGNDPVGAWLDQSANGRDFSQATTSKKPVWKPAQLNGKPAVYCDGIDDALKLTANLPAGTAGTIFAVAANPNMGADSGVYYSAADEAAVDTFAYFRIGKPGGSNSEIYFNNSGSANSVRGGTTLTTAFSYLTWTADGSAWAAWVNGSSESITILSGSNNGRWWDHIGGEDNHCIGGLIRNTTLAYEIYLAELLIYDTVLGAADRQAVETYLAAKYNL